MANASIEDLTGGAGGRGPANRGNPNTPAASENPGIQFKRIAFLKEGGTGVRSTDVRGGEKTTRSEWVGLDEAIKQQYKAFLRNYVDALARLNRQNPGLINNDLHRQDYEILKILTEEKIHADGARYREYDDKTEEKIEDFLKNPKGWILTTLALEHQTALQLFALGLHAAANPEAQSNEIARTGTIPLGIDQGYLNRFARVVWGRYRLGERAGQVGGREGQANILGLRLPDPLQGLRRWHIAGVAGVSGAVGLASAAALGAPALAGIGLTPSALVALNASLGSGVMMDLRQCGAAFEAIRQNPTEAAYLKEMAGIDVNNFERPNPIANPNLIARRAGVGVNTIGRVAEGTKDPEDIRRELVGNILSRFEFYTKIGVDSKRLNALPEQFLYLFSRGHAEQTGTHWAADLEREFNPNHAGIQSVGGETPEWFNPVTGNWEINPFFNPGNPDFRGNLERFMTARRNVMMRYITERIDRERSEASSLKDPAAAIKKGIEDRGAADFKEKRAATLVEERTRLGEYKDKAESERGGLDSYGKSIEALNNERTNLANEIRDTFAGAYPHVEAALTALQNATKAPGADVIIKGQTIENTIRRQNREFRRHSTERTRISKLDRETLLSGRLETPQSLARRQNDLYDENNEKRREELAKIQQDIAKINKLITKFQGAKDSISEKEKALANDQEQSRATIEQLANWERNRAEITGWSTPANVLDNAFLAAGDVDAIMGRINAANTANPAFGWPEQRNGDPAYRERVVQSVLEARAQELETADATRAARLPDYTALTGWNISENQLRYLTVEQISILVNTEWTRSGHANGWDAADNAANRPRVENAIREAQNRIQVRITAIDNFVRDANRTIEDRRFQIEAVNPENEIRQLKVTQEIINNFEPILNRVIDNTGIFRERARFMGPAGSAAVTPVAATDNTYTEAERTAVPATPPNPARGHERGYYEFLDLMFQYKNKSDRNERFRELSTVVTPDRLREIISNSLGGAFTPPPADFAAFLTTLDTEITAGNVNEDAMQRAIYSIMRTYIDEGVAMA